MPLKICSGECALNFRRGSIYNDAAQVAVGVGSIRNAFIPTAPGAVPVVFIGGIGSFTWELEEGDKY